MLSSFNNGYTAYALAAAALAYLLLARSKRYNRIERVQAEYAKRHDLKRRLPLTRAAGEWPTRKAYPMTPAEAQEIISHGLHFDLPWTIAKALEFALFKTYGIPTISKLLYETSEFSDKRTAGRRYVDTGALIFSFVDYPLHGEGSGRERVDGPLDPRGAIAVARMNYLHNRYRSKISNGDYLYTLSAFILEPAKWCSMFEWRSLTPLEEQAWHVFYSEIGRRMGIQDIPLELEDLYNWAENYEAEHMTPDPLCRDVAAATNRLLLHNVPEAMHGFGTKVVATLLYDRLREAVMLPPPPKALGKFVKGALNFRAFLLRNFYLPRTVRKSLVPPPSESPAFPANFDKASGNNLKPFAPKMHLEAYSNEAWYVKESTGLSATLQSVLLATGLVRKNQVPGPGYAPEGFRIEEVGPTKLVNQGHDQVKKAAEEMQGAPLEGPYAVGGMLTEGGRCPMGFSV